MTNWAVLDDAHGTAENVPALLEAARTSGNEFSEAWNDVWSHLCHQGTVYSASYAAIPTLTDICQRHRPGGYAAALHLAGAILASTDGPEDPASIRGRYQTEIATLTAVAERAVEMADDDTEFIYALEALMAFEDGDVWQRSLNYLAEDDAPLGCPACGDALLLSFEPVPTISTSRASMKPSQVTASLATSSVESRLFDLATANSRFTVATKLTYLFGIARCPNCGTTFKVSDGFD